MVANVRSPLQVHVPAVPLPRVRIRRPRRVETEQDAIRRQWESLLDAATSPAERDELNDVFGRALR